MKFDWERRSEGVFFATSPLRRLGRSHIEFLKAEAGIARLRRARVCFHDSETDAFQEMIIALSRETVLHPHYHSRRRESYHVVEGRARLVTFDEHGVVVGEIMLGGLGSHPDAVPFCSVSANVTHLIVPVTDFFVFHEAAQGPFEAGASIVPPWVDTVKSARPVAIRGACSP